VRTQKNFILSNQKFIRKEPTVINQILEPLSIHKLTSTPLQKFKMESMRPKRLMLSSQMQHTNGLNITGESIRVEEAI